LFTKALSASATYTTFDWREHEEALNCFAQFETDVDGVGMYFIHERLGGIESQFTNKEHLTSTGIDQSSTRAGRSEKWATQVRLTSVLQTIEF